MIIIIMYYHMELNDEFIEYLKHEQFEGSFFEGLINTPCKKSVSSDIYTIIRFMNMIDTKEIYDKIDMLNIKNVLNTKISLLHYTLNGFTKYVNNEDLLYFFDYEPQLISKMLIHLIKNGKNDEIFSFMKRRDFYKFGSGILFNAETLACALKHNNMHVANEITKHIEKIDTMEVIDNMTLLMYAIEKNAEFIAETILKNPKSCNLLYEGNKGTAFDMAIKKEMLNVCLKMLNNDDLINELSKKESIIMDIYNGSKSSKFSKNILLKLLDRHNKFNLKYSDDDNKNILSCALSNNMDDLIHKLIPLLDFCVYKGKCIRYLLNNENENYTYLMMACKKRKYDLALELIKRLDKEDIMYTTATRKNALYYAIQHNMTIIAGHILKSYNFKEIFSDNINLLKNINKQKKIVSCIKNILESVDVYISNDKPTICTLVQYDLTNIILEFLKQPNKCLLYDDRVIDKIVGIDKLYKSNDESFMPVFLQIVEFYKNNELSLSNSSYIKLLKFSILKKIDILFNYLIMKIRNYNLCIEENLLSITLKNKNYNICNDLLKCIDKYNVYKNHNNNSCLYYAMLSKNEELCINIANNLNMEKINYQYVEEQNKKNIFNLACQMKMEKLALILLTHSEKCRIKFNSILTTIYNNLKNISIKLLEHINIKELNNKQKYKLIKSIHKCDGLHLYFIDNNIFFTKKLKDLYDNNQILWLMQFASESYCYKKLLKNSIHSKHNEIVLDASKLNNLDQNGNNLLMLTLEMEYYSISYALLKITHMFNINIINSKGENALYIACKKKKEELALNILDYIDKNTINKITNINDTVLNMVVKNNLKKVYTELLKIPNYSFPKYKENSENITALMYAIKNKNYELTKEILKYPHLCNLGCYSNSIEFNGNTALMMITSGNWFDSRQNKELQNIMFKNINLCNVTHEDKNGKNALILLEESNNINHNRYLF